MTDIQDVPALIAPPWIGNTIQIFLLGVFTTMFARYASAGELRRHGTLGQVALWSSLVLNWVYTGLCVYESYYAAAWRIVFYVWMGLLMATQVVGYVSQFVGAIRDLRHLPDRPFTSQIGTTFSLWLWAAATADISISLVCAISLKSRLHGYTREVDSLLHRLVIICFRTAAYTSLMAIVAAILATIYHANFTLHLYITFAFWLGLPALYGIALFTFSTSSREAIKGRSRAADFDTSAAAVAAAATGDEGKAAPARPTTRVRHIQVGSSASRITSTASRIPLKVRVDREEVVAVEEPEFGTERILSKQEQEPRSQSPLT
ncbi:hypothetical protein C6P46_006068 [Rhodotorula mucilaginosa]|uniref:Uncharacterized protein n=1 Tax=Rhodotorula mucilaginosa TaxID=5537 RepID=A0A9P7B4F7_RHOMI|nr:hypothetical protein C6P46_006068 [Rhodotorula mucilaginosa]